MPTAAAHEEAAAVSFPGRLRRGRFDTHVNALRRRVRTLLTRGNTVGGGILPAEVGRECAELIAVCCLKTLPHNSDDRCNGEVPEGDRKATELEVTLASQGTR